MDTMKTHEPNSPLTVTSAYFEALAEGNIPGAMAELSPQVMWHQLGQNRFSGVHHGPEAVAALVGGMHQISGGTFTLEVTGEPMVNGAQVAYPVRFTGERDGVRMDMSGLDLLTVADDRIVSVHLFSADGPAEDRFWGQD